METRRGPFVRNLQGGGEKNILSIKSLPRFGNLLRQCASNRNAATFAVRQWTAN
jgi:hypothetical protein